MSKLTKRKRGQILNALLIVGTVLVVLYIGAANGNIGDAWNALLTAKPLWLAAAFGSWCVFVLFETLVLHMFLVMQKIPVRFGTSLIVSLLGIFYCNVTPGASGGQPMQVYAYKKRGIPSGYSSSGLAVKFFCYQLGLIVPTAILWICYGPFVAQHMTASRWFVYLGFIINGLGVVGVVLLAISRNLVRVILTFVVKIGARLHIVRDEARTVSHLDAALNDFNASVDMMVHHPWKLFFLVLLSCIQVHGLVAILYFVARSVGVDGYSYGQLITLAYLLYIGASSTPLPGGSGAQEGGFYLFFQNIFPADKLLGGLLLWRFFNYYFSIILTLIFGVILDSTLTIRGKIKPISFGRASSAGDDVPDDDTEAAPDGPSD